MHVTGISGIGVVEMDPEIVAHAEAALEELDGHGAGPEVTSTYHVEEGDVAENIIDFAEAKAAGLIVMATWGLTGIDRFVLGSNTERVVRTAPCPALTVPPVSDNEE
jgi:nucleotide-binding universal stress UspA family protein